MQLIILAVLIVLVIAGIGFLSRGESSEAESGQGELCFSFDMEDVTTLRIETEQNLLEVTRTGTEENGKESWYFADTGEAVNPLRVRQMLSEISKLRTQTVIGNVSDFTPYGLEEPSMIISVTDGKSVRCLQIGAYSYAGKMYYARTDTEDRVFLISTLIKTNFEVSKAELLAEEE